MWQVNGRTKGFRNQESEDVHGEVDRSKGGKSGGVVKTGREASA